ncbi:hypothetical protein WME88_51745 [Sorangium sp. So ce216]
MSYTMKPQAKRYHGHSYADTVLRPRGGTETKESRYVILRERDVRYRFHLHQHPYVQELTQRLLRRGTSALQAADTDYTPDGASIPGSLEVALAANQVVTVQPGPRIALLAQTQATSNGVAVALAANLAVTLAAAAQAALPDGGKANLVNGMTGTPPAGTALTPPPSSRAILFGDTRIRLGGAATIALFDGTTATIPAGTQVLLARGAEIVLPNGAQVTLLRSQRLPTLFADFFEAAYGPNAALVERPYPVKDLDFTASGAYSVYNWELFFHVPLTVALHLSKNQRFADAQRWFHLVFDPTDDSEGPTPERFWKVRPFQSTDVKKIEEILVNLATGEDAALRDETIHSIEAWKEAPFRPHVIARYRQQAYMYKTVMSYLDNLIAWGDSLFRQDTGEAIDEAMMLYVLAANILGPRPLPTPRKGSVRPETYANLRNDIQQFGTAMRDVEADIPFDLMPFPGDGAGDAGPLSAVRSLGKALYFCVPRNDKMLGYWDTVADRLFKIRNSLNFEGIFRQLALFEPPIDPAMLARAAAAGLDVGAIVNGVNQPLPLVRFQLLVQRAADICQEVKSLGNALLAAMEKHDGEAMAILRARHERAVLVMVEHVKYGQVQEAIKAREGLLESLALARQRYRHYERQLGKKDDEIDKAIPALQELDREQLADMKLTAKEPAMALRDIEVDIATDAFAQAARALNGGRILSSHEVREALFLEGAQLSSDIGAALSVASAAVAVVPQFEISAEPWGMGGATTFGGQNISSATQAFAHAARGIADRLNFEARRASRIDAFARRERDWAFQSNLAAGEINQILKQVRAAQIRQYVAERELESHRLQMKHAEEVEHFLNEEGADKNGKRTNKALYAWMKREVKGLYASSFQLAFDAARKAERALQRELGDPELRYLQYGYLAGNEGLLAGERLFLDVKRMEMAYHDLNRREYELTKTISLLQVDPMALIELRRTGRCTAKIPEELFDMDGPGHYFRRIKTVAVSIPCVAGPYAGVHCTLTLLKSSIRKTPVLRDGVYAREGAEDDRFDDHFGSLQSIVTSAAQNDSGLFETNLRDDRYLPFESSGVVSEWQLALPANPSARDPAQFDYDTVSDVLLHVRYTAREGGALLRNAAVTHLKEAIAAAQAAGSVRLFSARHDFPTEWASFQGQTPSDGRRFELRLPLRKEHYPFWSQGRLSSVPRVALLAQSNETPLATSLDVFDKLDKADTSVRTETLHIDMIPGLLQGRLTGGATGIALPARPDGEIKLYFDERAIANLWIAVTWSG